MTITAFYIALWAYLYTGPLGYAGQIFYPLHRVIYKATRHRFTRWLYNPLAGCAKCHAGWVAVGHEIWRGFGENSLPFILLCIAGAYALDTWHQIVEKWLNK